MKAKLKKFEEFVSTLYPSEVKYVLENNQYQDEVLIQILKKVESKVNSPHRDAEFDASIDLRKYSKLMSNFQTKLEKIDVDAYYEWISRVSHLITTDSIPAEEQSKIVKEIKAFTPQLFHAEVFYKMVQLYSGYLLMRMRYRDYETIKTFLETHRFSIEENQALYSQIEKITEQIVYDFRAHKNTVTPEKLEWLLQTFRNQTLSQKTRYWALLAYMMYHINQKQIHSLVEPIDELEAEVFDGKFYSRRILANFYANKLLLLDHFERYEEAIFCGIQSVKHHTQDYLYYINNYCSVLMHLKRYKEALQKMKSVFKVYQQTQNKKNQLIFISNYCRCLNKEKNFVTSARMAMNFLEEYKEGIFTYRWDYFLRVFCYALFKSGQSNRILRLAKRYKFQEKEQSLDVPPFLTLFVAIANFQELKSSETEFKVRLNELEQHPCGVQRLSFLKLCKEARELLG